MNDVTCYIVAASIAAYLVIIVLGYLMRRYVRKNLRGASNTQKKTLEVQRQLTMALILQVSQKSFFLYYQII
jgi:uncharacterized membrane-anchored protein YhcB (DUF1043 family)